jgi:hypothetical protein
LRFESASGYWPMAILTCAMFQRVVPSPLTSPIFSTDGERLLIVFQGLGVLAPGGIHPSDVVQGRPLALDIADLPVDSERLLIVLQRLGVLAPGFNTPHYRCCSGCTPSPLTSPIFLQSMGEGLLIEFQRLGVLAPGFRYTSPMLFRVVPSIWVLPTFVWIAKAFS